MGAIVAWFIETAIGAAIKGFWARFFLSKDEQLGELKQEVKENEMVIEAITDRQKVDQSVNAMPDDSAVIELSKWRKR